MSTYDNFTYRVENKFKAIVTLLLSIKQTKTRRLVYNNESRFKKAGCLVVPTYNL